MKNNIIDNIKPCERNNAVYKYLTLPKFISLLTYQALWFSKLNHLEDKLEGMIPGLSKFLPFINYMCTDNERGGRELTVVSCWFMNDSESIKMWEEYSSLEEGIVIKSTPHKLIKSIARFTETNIPTVLGKVEYVDHNNHGMNSVDANQALKRAFVKDTKFKHENELRISTMNWKTINCIHPDGHRYESSEVIGKDANNFENPGLYILVNIDTLFNEVIISPKATDFFYLLIKRMIELYGIKAPVNRSTLTKS